MAVRGYADEFCACLLLLSFVSQSPVNPAALFRGRGDLQVGVFMGSNGGRGKKSLQTPTYGLSGRSCPTERWYPFAVWVSG